ncbi:MAG: hypothetical protein JXQ73_22640 [Phycisphaerae bacterium]|nr:hypothetical protein [Phycisphaerae bacterium]
MLLALAKGPLLAAMIVVLANVCTPCDTTPNLEVDMPIATIDSENPNYVTITVTGQEGWDEHWVPGRFDNLSASLSQSSGGTGVGLVILHPYDDAWVYYDCGACPAVPFYDRRHCSWTLTFGPLPLIKDGQPDCFAIRFENTGEQQELDYTTPQLCVEEP